MRRDGRWRLDAASAEGPRTAECDPRRCAALGTGSIQAFDALYVVGIERACTVIGVWQQAADDRHSPGDASVDAAPCDKAKQETEHKARQANKQRNRDIYERS